MNKTVPYGSCLNSKTCKQCDVGYIIRQYVRPLMQMLTNDIQNYNMELKTTKCLNTAVMLGVFMLGRKTGLKIADYCDTEQTRDRHVKGIDSNSTIMQRLKKDILSKRTRSRWLYYILLTDGTLPHSTNPNAQPAYFSGHVFIIEKQPHPNKGMTFNFYQSYIGEYDLQGHLAKNNNSFSLNYDQVSYIMNNLDVILNKKVWDKECTKLWKDFTYVDVPHLEGYVSGQNIYVCFKKARVVHCLKHIEKYTQAKLKEIKELMKQNSSDNIYGNRQLYDETQSPLSYSDMYKQLKSIQQDLVMKSSTMHAK